MAEASCGKTDENCYEIQDGNPQTRCRPLVASIGDMNRLGKDHPWHVTTGGYLQDGDARGSSPFVIFDRYGRVYDAGSPPSRQTEKLPEKSWEYMAVCKPLAADPCNEASGCHTGPWEMNCKYDTCDDKSPLPSPRYGDYIVDSVRSVLPRFSGVVDGRLIPEARALDFAEALRAEIARRGFCTDTYKISDDEVSIGVGDYREHWDFCVASGAPSGMCFVVPENAFMIAVGTPPRR